MNVLHAYKVAHTEMYGGIPEVIRILSAPRPGVSSSILAARPRGWGRTVDAGHTPIRLSGSLGTLASMPLAPFYPFVLAGMARRSDVVALHLPFPLNDLGLALGLPDHVALVVHWHADIVGRKLLAKPFARVARRTLARADRIIVSDDVNLAMSAMLKPFRAKCATVPFGIDTGFWSDANGEARGEARRLSASHPRLVVAVGRLVPYKGFDILIEALIRADATAVIVGSGPERRRLERRIAANGLGKRIMLIGSVPREQLRVILHAARAFVFPSVSVAETFGISQLEAMAAGLPIVNTSLPSGVPVVARHGIEALTVPPRDPAQLADAINRLLDDRELAGRLGAAGRHRATAEFESSVFVDRVFGIYGQCVGERHRAAREA